MKKLEEYITPELELLLFPGTDIICSSGDDWKEDDSGDSDTPEQET